jgi:hypothetical protein
VRPTIVQVVRFESKKAGAPGDYIAAEASPPGMASTHAAYWGVQAASRLSLLGRRLASCEGPREYHLRGGPQGEAFDAAIEWVAMGSREPLTVPADEHSEREATKNPA